MLHLLTLLVSTASAADHPCDPAFPDACVDPSSTVAAGATIGDNARIGPDMAIGDAVIAPRAVLDGRGIGPASQPVGDGSTISRRATIGVDANIGSNVTIGRAAQVGTDFVAEDWTTVGYGAVLGNGVTLQQNAALGALTTVGNDSTIDGVLARSSTVGTDSTIRGIVGPDVQIGDRVTVDGRVRKQATIQSDATIAPGARVGRGANVGAGAVIEDGASVRAGAQIPDCSRLTDGEVAARNETWAGDTVTGCVDIGAYPIDLVSTQTNGQVFVTDLDVDPATGDVYIIGSQNYNATLAGVEVNGGGLDIFAAAFNADGGLLWLQPIQGTGTNRSGGLDYHNGALYIGGSFSGTLDVDTTTLTNVGAQADLFVARLDPSDGSHVWSRTLQTTANSTLVDVAASDDGVYIAGHFGETLALQGPGASSITAYTSTSPDAFVARLDAAGTWAWAGRVGGAGVETTQALTPLPGGGVATAVSFRGTLEAGTGALTSGLTSTHADDAVLVIVNASGTATYTRHLSGTGNNEVSALDAAGSRLVALATFRGPYPFGAATLQSFGLHPAVLEMDLTGAPITAYEVGADSVAYGQDIALRGDVAAIGVRLTESGSYTYGSYGVSTAGGSLAALDLSSGTWSWVNTVTGDSLAHPMDVVAQDVGDTPGFVVGGRYRNTVQVGAYSFTSPQLANAWIVEVGADGTW